MNLDVAIIHCIENKFNHKFERQARLYLESFKNTNPVLYDAVSIHFLQPTHNDILQDTIDYFHNNRVSFTKQLLGKLITSEINYFNKVITSKYFSDQLTNEYMCWIDTDVVWLKSVHEFFKPTNTVVVCLETDLSPITELYETYFKQFLTSEYQVELTHYVNTWFIYSKRENPMWREWESLSFRLLDIANSHINTNNIDVELICEELALSIICTKNPTHFTNIVDFFADSSTLAMTETGDARIDISTNTVLFHYTGVIIDPTHEVIQGINYKKETKHIMIQLLKNQYIEPNTMISISKRLGGS
jgi:hypothetical protein